MSDKKAGPQWVPEREFEDLAESALAARIADEESHVDHEQGFDRFVYVGHGVETSACSDGWHIFSTG